MKLSFAVSTGSLRLARPIVLFALPLQ